MKLSVIIPVFNEVATVGELLHRVATVPFPPAITATEIVTVKDGSTDGTAELLSRLQPCSPHLKVVHHAKNTGKGAALRTGIAAASGDILLFQDADLNQSARDSYSKLLAKPV
jgi:glycosyltransferase involved in cell wall biosynthesis